MNERPLPAGVTIRRGGPADLELVRTVAEQVFGHLGDYGRILPSWLLHDGVVTHVADPLGPLAQDASERPRSPSLGFTMLAYYPVTREQYVADLLAIAVAPGAQGRGVGKALLAHAVEVVRAAKRRLALEELRLSVADSNLRARRLFSTFGFELVEGDHGLYDGGQVALHLTLRL